MSEKDSESKIPNTNERGNVFPQYLAAFTAFLSMFGTGLHYAWTSPSIPKLLSNEFPLNITVEEAGYIATIANVGDIIGSVLYPTLANTIGMKITIILLGVPQFLSMMLIYFSSYSVILLYIARIFGGISQAGCYTVLPLYVGEISEPRIRGILGSCMSIFILTGCIVMNFIGYALTIEKCALYLSVLPVFFIVSFSFMPESPYYFIKKSNMVKAKESLKKLRWKNDVNKELEQLEIDINRQMSESRGFKDLYTIKSNRRACLVMFGLKIIQQFSGISAMIIYLQTIFERTPSIIPKQYSSILAIFILLFMTLVVSSVIDKFGRRPLLLISCIGGCITLTFLATFYLITDITDTGNFSLIGMLLYFVFIGLGQGCVVNLMPGELFSTSIKAKASIILNIINGILLFSTTKILQFTMYKYGLSVPFFLFAFCEFLGVIFCYYLVPETKGKTLEEIQVYFRNS